MGLRNLSAFCDVHRTRVLEKEVRVTLSDLEMAQEISHSLSSDTTKSESIQEHYCTRNAIRRDATATKISPRCRKGITSSWLIGK